MSAESIGWKERSSRRMPRFKVSAPYRKEFAQAREIEIRKARCQKRRFWDWLLSRKW